MCLRGRKLKERRKLRNEELYGSYSPGIVQKIKIMRMRWAESVARMGKERNAFRVLVQDPVGMSMLGKC